MKRILLAGGGEIFEAMDRHAGGFGGFTNGLLDFFDDDDDFERRVFRRLPENGFDCGIERVRGSKNMLELKTDPRTNSLVPAS